MDIDYPIHRRIWRIVYPVLIFIAIQIFVMIIIGIALSAVLVIGAMWETRVFDMASIMDDALQFMTERSMLILLVSNISGLMVFTPIWLQTRKRLIRRRNYAPAVICLKVAGLFAALNIFQVVIFSLTDVMKYFPSYDEISDMLTTDSFIVQLLAMGIAAPIIEELIFRGILINRMSWLPVWAAVLIQGVLFGAVHLNLFQSLYAFVAGVLLGMIYVKFRSILIVIAGHMAYNLSSLLASKIPDEQIMVVVLLFSIVLLPVCAVLTVKHKKAEAIMSDDDILPPPAYIPEQHWDWQQRGGN